MANRLRRVLAIAVLGGWLPTAALADAEDIRRNALAGSVDAQLEMGILYEFGFHMPDNEIEALAWYLLAAENGSKRAGERRDLLVGRLTESQRNDAMRRRANLNAAPPQPSRAPSPEPAPEAADLPEPAEISPPDAAPPEMHAAPAPMEPIAPPPVDVAAPAAPEQPAAGEPAPPAVPHIGPATSPP